MISKKLALTSVLLSSTVLLNGCDWFDSEPRNIVAETAQETVTKTSLSAQPAKKDQETETSSSIDTKEDHQSSIDSKPSDSSEITVSSPAKKYQETSKETSPSAPQPAMSLTKDQETGEIAPAARSLLPAEPDQIPVKDISSSGSTPQPPEETAKISEKDMSSRTPQPAMSLTKDQETGENAPSNGSVDKSKEDHQSCIGRKPSECVDKKVAISNLPPLELDSLIQLNFQNKVKKLKNYPRKQIIEFAEENRDKYHTAKIELDAAYDATKEEPKNKIAPKGVKEARKDFNIIKDCFDAIDEVLNS